MKVKLLAGLVALMTCLPATGWAQTAIWTWDLGTLAGRYNEPTVSDGLYGADLGIPVRYGNEIRFLFGDGWSNGNGDVLGDVVGYLPLYSFYTGEYVYSHSLVYQEFPRWKTDFPMNLKGSPTAIQVYVGGNEVDMGDGRTPIAAFSNLKSSGGATFAIFNRAAPKTCDTDGDCGTGYVCDAELGGCDFPIVDGDPYGEDMPCLEGLLSGCGALCLPNPQGQDGICVDQDSPLYGSDQLGRIQSVLWRHVVANAHSSSHWRYYGKEYTTHRFTNVTARTVRDFRPDRPYDSSSNNYRPANGTGANEKVFLFGRPHFLGRYPDHSAKLYFAYVDMPSYDGGGNIAWAPKYFTGFGSRNCTTSNRPDPSPTYRYPCFDTNEKNARPLNLSAPGGDNTVETQDFTLQQTVAWVPYLNKFVMIYGGDLTDPALWVLNGWLPDYYAYNVRNPLGAMGIRYASYPWGPWTPPQIVLVGGDWDPPTWEYATEGALWSRNCTGSCIKDDIPPDPMYEGAEPFYVNLDNAAGGIWGDTIRAGRWYGPNIVDQWTLNYANSAYIFWTASTWNPYQVVVQMTLIYR